jgi:hypothetical protein
LGFFDRQGNFRKNRKKDFAGRSQPYCIYSQAQGQQSFEHFPAKSSTFEPRKAAIATLALKIAA